MKATITPNQVHTNARSEKAGLVASPPVTDFTPKASSTAAARLMAAMAADLAACRSRVPSSARVNPTATSRGRFGEDADYAAEDADDRAENRPGRDAPPGLFEIRVTHLKQEETKRKEHPGACGQHSGRQYSVEVGLLSRQVLGPPVGAKRFEIEDSLAAARHGPGQPCEPVYRLTGGISRVAVASDQTFDELAEQAFSAMLRAKAWTDIHYSIGVCQHGYAKEQGCFDQSH